MGVLGPRLEIGLRVIRWVAEEILGEREPGAQAVGGRLEHMFVTLGWGPDGMGLRLQGLPNRSERAAGGFP